MRRLRAFIGLDKPERRLLLQAIWFVAMVRVALLVLPFHRVHAFVQARAVPDRDALALKPEGIAWSVGRAASTVPGANCLVQALAASIMLARKGRAGTVRVGARRVGRGLQAHAWVECDGRVVVGDRDDLSTFHALSRASDDTE